MKDELSAFCENDIRSIMEWNHKVTQVHPPQVPEWEQKEINHG